MIKGILPGVDIQKLNRSLFRQMHRGKGRTPTNMYSYTWDAETGGLLLNSSPLSFSKEPRPVYYKELDILGFDRYWNYAKNDSYPYMWAEANNYFYRGRQVAKTKGGSLYTAPEIIIMDDPEPNGQPLRFVDIPAMVEKNRDLLEKLSAETIKKIYNTYVEYMSSMWRSVAVKIVL